MPTTDLQRYSRQMLLPEVGNAGQQRLAEARVLLVGAGGLGSAVALYLAAMGVGVAASGLLRIVDPDHVELSNLHRQLLHEPAAIGQNKVESAKARLQALNPQCHVDAVAAAIDADNTATWVQDADVVVDSSDNFAARFALNAACQQQRVNLVSGAAIRWQGQLVNFLFAEQARGCYACLYDPVADTVDNCSSAGVMPPVVGIIGSAQALATAQLLIGHSHAKPEHAVLQRFDAIQHRWQRSTISPDPACSVCAG